MQNSVIDVIAIAVIEEVSSFFRQWFKLEPCSKKEQVHESKETQEFQQ